MNKPVLDDNRFLNWIYATLGVAVVVVLVLKHIWFRSDGGWVLLFVFGPIAIGLFPIMLHQANKVAAEKKETRN